MSSFHAMPEWAIPGRVFGRTGLESKRIFACFGVEDGKRQWKGGRYGHGQVLLVADLDVLLVLTEQGEVVLVAASPDRHQELTRMKALSGKTWNHPVVAHGKLLVRNGNEMACFELPQ